MKKTVLGVMLLLFSILAMAGQDEYDECILKHLKGARIDVVTHLIMQACQQNYKSPSFTSDKIKLYNQCLLENLPGIESVPAAMEIKEVCHRKSRKSKVNP